MQAQGSLEGYCLGQRNQLNDEFDGGLVAVEHKWGAFLRRDGSHLDLTCFDHRQRRSSITLHTRCACMSLGSSKGW